jgi:hypothetical protein
LAGFEIIEIGEHAAMGNVTDGWNVYVVLQKTKARFPSREKFEGLPYESSKKGEFNTSPLDMVESVDRFPADDEQPTESLAELIDPKNILSIGEIKLEVEAETKSIMSLVAQSQHTNPQDYANEVIARFNGTYEAKPETVKVEQPKKKRGRPSKK